MPEDRSRIRRLGLGDCDELLALWQRAGLHSLKPRRRDSVQPLVVCQLASGVQTILGLEVDGYLVGAVASAHNSRKGWANRLMIDPAYCRRGYGARLIAVAEQVLREQGMRAIAANLTLLALFQKVDYVKVDPTIHCLSNRDSDAVWKQCGSKIQRA